MLNSAISPAQVYQKKRRPKRKRRSSKSKNKISAAAAAYNYFTKKVEKGKQKSKAQLALEYFNNKDHSGSVLVLLLQNVGGKTKTSARCLIQEEDMFNEIEGTTGGKEKELGKTEKKEKKSALLQAPQGILLKLCKGEDEG